MKPITKLQKQVYELSQKMPDVGKEVIDWAKEKLFKKYVYTIKKGHTCFECGHFWEQSEQKLAHCPHCNAKLTYRYDRVRTIDNYEYFYVITTFEGFQILRYFQANMFSKIGHETQWHIFEIFQHWINNKGKNTIMAVNCNPIGYQRYWYFTPLQIKRDHDRYYINAYPYPKRKIIPELKRNGFKQSFHNWHPVGLFELLLSDPYFETIFKMGRYDLMPIFSSTSYEKLIHKYWPQIKIILRNNYDIKNYLTWFDHLKSLEYFNKDIFSPKYICPKDLQKEHDKLIEKRRKIEAKETLEKLKESIEKSNIEYQKRIKKYFDLNIKYKDITIAPIKSVEDFYYEGDILRHCIFQNEYYERKNSLILSARTKSKRLETIEIDIQNLRIVQIHGFKHQPSDYREQIFKTIMFNMKKIKKIRDSKTIKN